MTVSGCERIEKKIVRDDEKQSPEERNGESIQKKRVFVGNEYGLLQCFDVNRDAIGSLARCDDKAD
jgi:hypothetical protein